LSTVRTDAPVRPVSWNLDWAPAAGIGSELERIAYAFLCVFIFAIPCAEAEPLLGGFEVARALGALAFGAAILRAIVVWRSRKPCALHYWMFGLVGWATLSLFWTLDWETTTTRVSTYLQSLLAVWLIWELAAFENRVRGLLQAYIFGTLVCSMRTLFNFVMGRTAAQVYAARGQNVWNEARYTISGLNENDLGLMLALSLAMTFYLLARRRKGTLTMLLLWLHLVVCITCILLTGSRGAMLAAGVSLMMFPLIVYRLPRWQRITSIVAFVVTLSCGAYLVPEATWQRLLLVTTEISSGTLTHRTVIWAAGLEAFRNHAFLGVGAGAYAPAILKAVDIPYVAHNTFLSVLVELGVVGALLLFGLLASMVYCVLRMQYLEKCLWITLLLTWTVGVSALTWEYRKPTWLLFGLLAAHTFARRRRVSRAQRMVLAAPQCSRRI
jgi:O-antigen ligase